MKRLLKFLVVFMMLFGIFGCTNQGGNSDVSLGEIKITGLGLDLTLDSEVLSSYELKEIDTTSLSSKGDLTELTITGYDLAEILKDNSIDLFADTGNVVLKAADGYEMTAANQEYAKDGIYILVKEDDEALESYRSAIPTKRAMYWVKDLVEIELLEVENKSGNNKNDATTGGSLTQIQFFYENSKDLAVHSLNYKDTQQDFISLNEYNTAFNNTDLKTLTIKAADGFERSETSTIFNSAYISKFPNDSEFSDVVPLYYSEEMGKGMTMKQIQMAVSQNLAIYFGNEITVSELFDMAGMADAKEYVFVASDGFEMPVPKETIEKGKIFLDEEEGFVRVSFPDSTSLKGKGNLKHLSYINAVVDNSGSNADAEAGDKGDSLFELNVKGTSYFVNEEEFMSLPIIEHEISRTNSYQETTVGVYKGVHWSELAKKFEFDADVNAKFVASDGFEALSTSDILNHPDTMIALYQDGEYIRSEGDGKVWLAVSDEFTANNWIKFISKIIIE